MFFTETRRGYGLGFIYFMQKSLFFKRATFLQNEGKVETQLPTLNNAPTRKISAKLSPEVSDETNASLSF
jgi:hypothetical protein